jgi:hypothetical protein
MDLQGVALDLALLYQAGRDIADTDEWPQWNEASEYRVIRERSSAARAQK